MAIQITKSSRITSYENLYNNRQNAQLTLKSIFKPSSKQISKTSSNQDKPKHREIKPKNKYTSLIRERKECTLIPNGTWAHIPLKWLNIMSSIIDIINKAIQENDIEVLNQLQDSQKEFYQQLIDSFPSDICKSYSSSSLMPLNEAEKGVEEIISFTKTRQTDIDSQHQQSEECPVIDEESRQSGSWFIPNTSIYLQNMASAPFQELLELLRSLPTNTKMALSQTGTNVTNHTLDDDDSESLTVMSLIPPHSGGSSRGLEFESLVLSRSESNFPWKSGKFNKQDDSEYDDSDYAEFNIKYTKNSSKKSEASELQVSEICDEKSIKDLNSDETNFNEDKGSEFSSEIEVELEVKELPRKSELQKSIFKFSTHVKDANFVAVNSDNLEKLSERKSLEDISSENKSAEKLRKSVSLKLEPDGTLKSHFLKETESKFKDKSDNINIFNKIIPAQEGKEFKKSTSEIEQKTKQQHLKEKRFEIVNNKRISRYHFFGPEKRKTKIQNTKETDEKKHNKEEIKQRTCPKIISHETKIEYMKIRKLDIIEKRKNKRNVFNRRPLTTQKDCERLFTHCFPIYISSKYTKRHSCPKKTNMEKTLNDIFSI